MNKRASQNKPELWIEEDRRLFYAEAITIKSTGECFKVEDKLARIHTYMVDQYNSYQADGKSFYEDQRDIATKCKCTPKTLGKWLKVLQALGLLIIDESQKSHSYTVRSVVSQEHNLIFSYPKLLNGKPSYDHEEALKRLHASEEHKKTKKTAQPIIEESENGEQSVFVVPAPATVDHEQRSGVSQPAGDSGDAISSDDGVTGKNIVKMPWIESPFDNGRLVSEARRWAQSQGASTWQDEIKLVWKLTGKTNIGEPGEHMRPDDVPAPEPAKQKANGYTLYEGTPKEPDWNEDEQF
ncbi:hypothetical protein ROM06_10410 [Cronobacter sakazakii]|uniref:DUF6945 domain-containing protein n=1 Tax=Cronobacter sakazakii TaxID=28141 RepID=UPI001BE13B94|nr:hypothetical protein [Cronobacter sakazakii]MDT3552607.1 hypothetical protein [Cronobacter sakazakii]HAX4736399.1 hypothetical protein [Escherichia coli]HBD4738049.1 hypothetical protein [Escherichia coli]